MVQLAAFTTNWQYGTSSSQGHPVRLHDGKMIRDGKGLSNGTGQTVGGCGLAQLILHAGASSYLLTLFSSAGGMGVGTYSVFTHGLFQVSTPGTINANGATAWISHTQRVLDPGLFARSGRVTGLGVDGGRRAVRLRGHRSVERLTGRPDRALR
jgi:hypothetical protein